ncbi:hypothetical protein H4I96_12152 [Botrytis cinerea]
MRLVKRVRLIKSGLLELIYNLE